uniref:TATA element modulatory factor 1 n=1 Tax=Anolis carolinensis TaxID=28377 RepID=A0A803U196_ANOCA
MSWFNASHLSTFAKQALSQAQKSIDRVLDIQAGEEEEEGTWANLGSPGTNSLTTGGWDTSTWGANSTVEPQSQPISSPTAITKPVRRIVVDESDTFFSAFLSPTDVQNIQISPVVSTPPTKSQRPKEEVKNTIQDSLDADPPEAEDFPVTSNVELIDFSDSQETVEGNNSVSITENVCDENSPKDDDQTESPENPKEADSTVMVKSSSGSNGPELRPELSAQSLSSEAKNVALDTKERKSEDRQSNTPSPPVSTFSSGTSTTSDIEVLDHESVISESSVSSRQEASDSKASLHLMQTSFQLLSASACTEYNRLDDFQKLTESCCSSDAFERIDSFSVQSLDSRSVSEINSDDELSGRGCTSASVNISTPVLKSDETESVKSKPDQIQNESLVLPAEEIEMEESGRSATPVNSEQPDVLAVSLQTDQRQIQKEEPAVFQPSPGKLSNAECEKEELCKIIDSLTEKLEMRETRLLSISKEKASLEEAYDNLKDEVFKMKEENSSISSLKEEFAQRIADAEKKVQLACKERDAAKKEVKNLKEDLATRLNSNETAELLKEKDEQIKGLLEEGEKLSKQQLQSSNIIKKLRAKEKEKESINTKQSKKIQELKMSCKDLEKQHRENIKQLNSLVERQEKDLVRLHTDLEDLEERNRSVQAALDGAYKELADLHKANAAKDCVAQEAALSHEIKMKEELGLALEKAQEEARQQQEALAIQVADLRLALQRAEQQTARKEDYLRQEISELQQRLQEAESRNQELSQSVTSATRPLLRQIENLQATLGAQTLAWEKLEKNLSDRLGESQTALAAQTERERAATEELLSNKIQLSSTESQNSILRQENSRLQAQLEGEKTRLKKLENENNRYEVELENLKEEYVKTVEEAKKEKMLLATQLEMEKIKVEQEKKKAVFVQETAREKVLDPIETVSSTPSLSRSSSISGVDMAGLQASLISQDDPHEHSFGSLSTSGNNLYDAVRMGAGSSIIENLQSQLKLRDGEVSHLQLEIGNLERTRSVMAEELVKLTNQNDDLEEKVKEIPKLRAQLRDLDQRYNTILQMYGEKAEEAEELRLDLEDVKNMYKTQIDELLKQRHS